jgi:predicted SPOUT superfamily RNA methylase MTH1
MNVDNSERRFVMKGKSKITVTSESATGRNTRFDVPGQGDTSRQALVQQIRHGDHPGYHVRVINGLATPVSNPDGSVGNNLD